LRNLFFSGANAPPLLSPPLQNPAKVPRPPAAGRVLPGQNLESGSQHPGFFAGLLEKVSGKMESVTAWLLHRRPKAWVIYA
jgi:hypothetical protein